jgi:hypothetical protein
MDVGKPEYKVIIERSLVPLFAYVCEQLWGPILLTFLSGCTLPV